VNQVVPFSAFDSSDPAELWKYMDAYATKTGGQVLAIPHNGNLSNGMMYSAETFDGKPMDRAYAEARASHEPLLEATQIKGDSETQPLLSTTDEFATFERWDFNFGGTPVTDVSVLKGNYVRSALKLGLELAAKLGVNPYEAGMIGGNDAHVGVAQCGKTISLANSPTDYRRRNVGKLRCSWVRMASRWSRCGKSKLRDWAACGLGKTLAREYGTRSSARKFMPRLATG
jgi:hypothetical protein